MKITCVLCITLGLLVAKTQLAGAQDETDDEAAFYPAALIPFKERGAEVEGLGTKVSDLLYANLLVNPELFLVDREDLKEVFGELELSSTGVVRPSEANKIGQLTGAKLLVTGSVLQVDNTTYLVAKVIGTETSRVVGTSVKGGVKDDLGDLVEELGEKLSTAIVERSGDLIAKPVTRDDRVAALTKALGKGKKPSLFIEIEEQHIGQRGIDPAAETEVTLFAADSGFTVIDPDSGEKSRSDILVTGEGLSEFAARHGNLVSVKARLEVKAVERLTGEIVAIDRETCVGLGSTEQIAGKDALQQAAANIAERMLPKLVKSDKKKKN